MGDSPAPVICDGCGEPGRRPLGHAAPHFWFFIESQDQTPGRGGSTYIVWACSEECRDKLWQRGPGPSSIDEDSSERMRRRLTRKEQD